MAVTRDDVLRIAELARLALTEERVLELVSQLNEILKHMDVLRDRASAGVPAEEPPPPVLNASPPTRLRPDVGPPLPLAMPREQFAARTLDGAQGMRDGFYLVPRLDTHDAGEGPQ
jgi:aspartyl/glutamyl-tRNA(Asn/Gln) amidotransferase C subunit